ncbi:hypothetical protein [Streptomyces sp. NPDC056169]|uniref:hypothetical protein n=1 Tax=Streptomyces sp. NPDC056169 TaxID=3345734 RepID=UPI0035DDE00D
MTGAAHGAYSTHGMYAMPRGGVLDVRAYPTRGTYAMPRGTYAMPRGTYAMPRGGRRAAGAGVGEAQA